MSVCGTGPPLLTLGTFLGRPLYHIPPAEAGSFAVVWNCLAATGGFSCRSSSQKQHKSNNMRDVQIFVLPLKKRRSHGILTVCPSPSAFAIGLGPTNPSLTIIEKETLVFRRPDFSSGLWLLVPTFLLPNAPPRVTPLASSQIGILSYRARTSLPLGTSLPRCESTNKDANSANKINYS